MQAARFGYRTSTEEFGPAWLNTAAKGNYRQAEKLSRMEKSKLAEKAML